MSDRHKTNHAWKWISVGVVIAGMFFVLRFLPVAEWLKPFNEWVKELGPTGLIVFAVVYVVATVLFVPGSVLTIGAGFAFGLGWGIVVVSIGATIGAALAFLIARYLARDKVAKKLKGHQKMDALDHAIGERGAWLILLLRLSPVIPFNLSNYFYGLTSVKFWPYVLASWIGMLPGAALYVYLGAAGKAGLQASGGGESSGRSPLEWTFFAVGLLATIVVTVIVTRIASKTVQDTQAGQAAEADAD